MPWVVNRELIGAILLLHERIDGIVLVSAFPCGPDSMTDDAKIRVESKDAMKKRGMHSPDEADCILLLCLPVKPKRRGDVKK